jgi:hypothetical protein
MRNRANLRVFTLPKWLALALPLVIPVAQDAEGGEDHPLIGRYAGSVLIGYEAAAYEEAVIIKGPIDARQALARSGPGLRTWEGRTFLVYYMLPESRSSLEVLRNYEAALTAKWLRNRLSMRHVRRQLLRERAGRGGLPAWRNRWRRPAHAAALRGVCSQLVPGPWPVSAGDTRSLERCRLRGALSRRKRQGDGGCDARRRDWPNGRRQDRRCELDRHGAQPFGDRQGRSVRYPARPRQGPASTGIAGNAGGSGEAALRVNGPEAAHHRPHGQPLLRHLLPRLYAPPCSERRAPSPTITASRPAASPPKVQASVAPYPRATATKGAP